MPRPRERSTLLKSVPRAPGRDRARQGDRSRPDRGLVRGRGPDRAEEQDHPALGTTGNAAFGAARSAHRSTYIFGAICPRDGKGAPLALPACNTEAMNLHLAEIAAEVAPDKHAVLVVDQAGWHLSAGLVLPDNITLVVLPPKCPELNPAENVWQFMRDNWLSNRVFASYTDLVDHCCEAWNKLIERPWTIMSIGLRDWANGF